MIPNPTVARAKAFALAVKVIEQRHLHAPIATQMLAGRFQAFLLAKPYTYDQRLEALEFAVKDAQWRWTDSIITLAEEHLAKLEAKSKPTWHASANVVRGPIEVLVPYYQPGKTTKTERHDHAKRIARLLNEDDAKGQITIRVHAGHRTTEEQEQAWSDYYQGSRR